MSFPARRGAALAVAACGAGLLLACLTLVHIEAGSIGVLPDGSVLPPGWHLSFQARRAARQGPGPIETSGGVQVDSPEGSRQEIAYRLRIDLAPAAIAAVAAEPASGSPARLWARAAEQEIRALAGRQGDFALLRAGAGRRHMLEALGRRPPLAGSRLADVRLGAAAAAQRQGRPMHAPVILVGLDGADWRVIEPLLAAGKLPTLRGLLDSGARAHLRSSPPLLSPLLWTSVATGVAPDRHGVVDFTVYDAATRDRAPISSRARKAPALWNILTAYGLDSAWIGWWATWPAEPVAGLMVSDRVAYSLFAVDGGEGSAGKVYPPESWPEVRNRLTPAARVPWEDLRAFVGLGAADLDRLRRRAAPAPGSDFDDRLDHLRQVVASTRTYFDVALLARRRLAPDLLAVYFQGVDEVSHRFMHFVPPPRLRADPEEVRRFGGAVAAFYREQDRLLGALLADPWPGAPRPVVMAISDHGFLSGEARPSRPADQFVGGAADWHRLHGIFVVSGPGVRRSDLGTVSIYDVFPTLLYLCGIPVPEDLPGRVLLESFEDSHRQAYALVRTPALQVPFGPPPDSGAVLSERERAEELGRLRALGYVGAAGAGEAGPSAPPSGAAASGGARASAAPGRPVSATIDLHDEFLTAHMNLGALYSERGDWESAALEYRAVAQRFPSYAPALYKHMESEHRCGRRAEAWAAAERLLGLDARPAEWLPAIAAVAAAAGEGGKMRAALAAPRRAAQRAPVWSALGILDLGEGRTAEGTALLWRALEADPLRVEALETLYELDASPRVRERLIGALRRALDVAPRSVLHLNYLAGLLVAAGRCSEARPHLSAALEEDPDSAPAYVNLAKCQAAEGSLQEAVATLERGLARAPDDLALLTTLGALEAGRGRLERGVALLERASALAPRDTAILNALGLAHLQSGARSAAREILGRSLAADPAQPEVRALLEQIPN